MEAYEDGRQGPHTMDPQEITRRTSDYNVRRHDLNTRRRTQGDYTQLGNTAGPDKPDKTGGSKTEYNEIRHGPSK